MQENNEAGKCLVACSYLLVVNGANVGFLIGPKNRQCGNLNMDMSWPLEDSIVLCISTCDLKLLKIENVAFLWLLSPHQICSFTVCFYN